MVANDTSTPAFYRSANRQKIVMASVQNKSQSLVGYTKESGGSRDAPARLFQSSTDEVAFVTKDFRVERKAWRQFHGVRGCGCCLFKFSECSRKNTPGAFAKASFDAGIL